MRCKWKNFKYIIQEKSQLEGKRKRMITKNNGMKETAGVKKMS